MFHSVSRILSTLRAIWPPDVHFMTTKSTSLQTKLILVMCCVMKLYKLILRIFIIINKFQKQVIKSHVAVCIQHSYLFNVVMWSCGHRTSHSRLLPEMRFFIIGVSIIFYPFTFRARNLSSARKPFSAADYTIYVSFASRILRLCCVFSCMNRSWFWEMEIL